MNNNNLNRELWSMTTEFVASLSDVGAALSQAQRDLPHEPFDAEASVDIALDNLHKALRKWAKE